MRIARVFPRKTNMSPTDKDYYFDEPDLFTPNYNEVYVSVTFTWDIKKGHRLLESWRKKTDNPKIGGPAFDDFGYGFMSGMYVKQGVTITSRGCPNNCQFCFVPKREGKIRELPIVEGNIVQDNNLLACSKFHIKNVFKMLKTQRHIDFAGGFEARRVTDDIVEDLRGLNIYQMWLAYDTVGQEIELLKAVEKLKKYFPRDKIRCFVLIGYENDTLIEAERRLKWAYSIGTLPFAMRYRTSESQWKGSYLFKERPWNLLARQWTRPAIIKSIMKY